MQETINNLFKFIKRNRRLIHLDLTCTGLTAKMMEMFGRTLRRSKSLRAIHLSGNPGLADPREAERITKYLVERIHGIRVDNFNVIDFKEMPSNQLFSRL